MRFQCIVCQGTFKYRFGRRPCICKGCARHGMHLHKPPKPKPPKPRP